MNASTAYKTRKLFAQSTPKF